MKGEGCLGGRHIFSSTCLLFYSAALQPIPGLFISGWLVFPFPQIWISVKKSFTHRQVSTKHFNGHLGARQIRALLISQTKPIFCFCSQQKWLLSRSLIRLCVYVVVFSCSLPFSFQLSAQVHLPLNYVNCYGENYSLHYGQMNSGGVGAGCQLLRLPWPVLGCRDACCPERGLVDCVGHLGPVWTVSQTDHNATVH